jgi:hypothetical protein
MRTDRELKDEQEIAEIVYRRSFSSGERQLAEAKAAVIRMSAEVERVQVEAHVARQEARELREHVIATATRSSLPSPRTALKALAIVVMSTAICRFAYVGYTHPATPAPLASLNRFHTAVVAKSAASGSQDFKQAMSRLQDDLDSLPGSPSEIVHEVNQKHLGSDRPCPLEWVNGQAALSLDATSSLRSAVAGCADAVEKLRAKN